MGSPTDINSASLLIAAGIAWQAPAVGLGILAIVAAIFFILILRRIDIGGRPQASSDDSNVKTRGWGIIDRPGFVAHPLVFNCRFG